MDDFEQAHVKGEGSVLFRDKIPLPKYLLALFLAAPLMMFATLFGSGFGLLPALGIALGMGAVATFANLALMGQRLIVSEGGIDVFIGMRKHHYDFNDIVSVEVDRFRLRDYPLGRGQVKHSLKGRAFVSRMKADGVKLMLRSGKHVFIESTDPAGLQKTLLERDATRVRVDAAEAEPEHEEVEVEASNEPAEATVDPDHTP